MNNRATTVARRPFRVVGVDFGPDKISAGVFTDSLQFLGKFKKSTKPERGPEAVVARIARCVRDAADECDLTLDDIAAVGLGAPGTVEADGGSVVAAPQLGWENVPLRAELEKQLGVPVHLENIHGLGAFGIYTEELKSRPRTFAAVFWGTDLGGGFCAGGELNAEFDRDAFAEVIAKGQREILRVLPPELRHFRGRDMRKALRKGDRLVTSFVRDAAGITGTVAASIIERFAPEVLAVGGGVMEEMKDEWMAIIGDAVAKNVSPDKAKETRLTASTLGGNASMVGGAVLAVQCEHAGQGELNPA